MSGQAGSASAKSNAGYRDRGPPKGGPRLLSRRIAVSCGAVDSRRPGRSDPHSRAGLSETAGVVSKRRARRLSPRQTSAEHRMSRMRLTLATCRGSIAGENCTPEFLQAGSTRIVPDLRRHSVAMLRRANIEWNNAASIISRLTLQRLTVLTDCKPELLCEGHRRAEPEGCHARAAVRHDVVPKLEHP